MLTKYVLNRRGVFWLTWLVMACGAAHGCSTPSQEISVDSLMSHIQQLSSDEFEGRSPGTEGGVKTVTYLTDQFRSLGLEPGNPDGTYVQPVPLVGITPRVGETLQVQPQNGKIVFLEPGAT